MSWISKKTGRRIYQWMKCSNCGNMKPMFDQFTGKKIISYDCSPSTYIRKVKPENPACDEWKPADPYRQTTLFDTF